MRAPLSIDELRALGRQRSAGVALGDSQAATLGLVASFAFFSPWCCPSQRLLGAMLGLSQPRVCVILQRLRDLGLLESAPAHRLGARWPHLRHYVTHWQPPSRARLLEFVRAAKARLYVPSPAHRRSRWWLARYTEGTATTSSRTQSGLERAHASPLPPPGAADRWPEPEFEEVEWVTADPRRVTVIGLPPLSSSRRDW